MARRRKGLKIFFIVLFILIAGFAAFAYFTYDRIVIIQDEGFGINLPLTEYIDFGWQQFKNGNLLKVITLKREELLFNEDLLRVIQSCSDSKLIFFSPLVTACIIDHSLKIKLLLTDTITVGTGMNDAEGCFDIILLSDVNSGWAEANALGKRYIPVRSSEDTDNTSDTDMFIPDYRYRHSVKKQNRLGVVCPALNKSLQSLAELGKKDFFDGMTGILMYEFKPEGKLF